MESLAPRPTPWQRRQRPPPPGIPCFYFPWRRRQRPPPPHIPRRHLMSRRPPAPLHYLRKHGLVPKADWSTWTVEVAGLVKRPAKLIMDQLATEFEAVELPLTLVCAGNRRKEQNMVRQTVGFSWGPGAISTSVWRGAWLRDMLRRCRLRLLRGRRGPPRRRLQVRHQPAAGGGHGPRARRHPRLHAQRRAAGARPRFPRARRCAGLHRRPHGGVAQADHRRAQPRLSSPNPVSVIRTAAATPVTTTSTSLVNVDAASNPAGHPSRAQKMFDERAPQQKVLGVLDAQGHKSTATTCDDIASQVSEGSVAKSCEFGVQDEHEGLGFLGQVEVGMVSGGVGVLLAPGHVLVSGNVWV
ncbi:hypothetical protein BS78_02G131800 [Paspalum vaginatum]|nr:hypothetical protein BS78_02G131800 [Paspalum vaginatum]